MGKKRKRKLRSGKKWISELNIDIDSEEEKLSITLKRIRKNNQQKLTKIKFTLVGKYWGFHYPSKNGKSKVPVIDVHGQFNHLNLRIRRSKGFVLAKLREWQETGFSYAIFIHGDSKQKGWKDFLMGDSCPFECQAFSLPNRDEHPHVSIVVLNSNSRHAT